MIVIVVIIGIHLPPHHSSFSVSTDGQTDALSEERYIFIFETHQMMMNAILYLTAILSFQQCLVSALNIVIAGGTGPVGRLLASTLHNQNDSQHQITILTRNSFLASSPSRVSGDFGWLGRAFLEEHESVRLRDWDGGDLLDIVGCDFLGWQEDALKVLYCNKQRFYSKYIS